MSYINLGVKQQTQPQATQLTKTHYHQNERQRPLTCTKASIPGLWSLDFGCLQGFPQPPKDQGRKGEWPAYRLPMTRAISRYRDSEHGSPGYQMLSSSRLHQVMLTCPKRWSAEGLKLKCVAEPPGELLKHRGPGSSKQKSTWDSFWAPGSPHDRNRSQAGKPTGEELSRGGASTLLGKVRLEVRDVTCAVPGMQQVLSKW